MTMERCVLIWFQTSFPWLGISSGVRIGVPRQKLDRWSEEKNKLMLRLVSIALLILGASVLASALPAVPEIDAGTGMNVLALLAGAALVVRAGIKK